MSRDRWGENCPISIPIIGSILLGNGMCLASGYFIWDVTCIALLFARTFRLVPWKWNFERKIKVKFHFSIFYYIPFISFNPNELQPLPALQLLNISFCMFILEIKFTDLHRPTGLLYYCIILETSKQYPEITFSPRGPGVDWIDLKPWRNKYFTNKNLTDQFMNTWHFFLIFKPTCWWTNRLIFFII